MAGELLRRRAHGAPRFRDRFEDFAFDFRLRAGEHIIGVEESTEDGDDVVRAEAPGIDPDKDAQITVEDGVPTVHAERVEKRDEERDHNCRVAAMRGADVSGPLVAGSGGRSSWPETVPPVLTLTLNPCVDICYEVERLSHIGKTRARVRFVSAGGGGINVARGVARLGGRATAVHTAGREVGQRLSRLLDEEGVDHLATAITGETREAFLLFETESRRGFHIVPPGPRLDESDARRCLELLDRAVGTHRYVVASGSLPRGLPDDFYATVARRVQGAGSRLVLDTSGPALRESLHERVFLRRCNNHEASCLVGRAVRSFDDARAVNEYLLGAGEAVIAVTTLGELGALCSTGRGHTELHAPPLPGEPLSDAGAGDGMVAALTMRLATGDDPVEACAFGVAVAAASVLTPGIEPFDREVAESLYPAVRIKRQAAS